MRCDCGGKTMCADSRDSGDFRRRRYECYSCKKRFSTLELKFDFGSVDLEKDLRDLAFYERYMEKKKTIINLVKHLRKNNKKGF